MSSDKQQPFISSVPLRKKWWVVTLASIVALFIFGSLAFLLWADLQSDSNQAASVTPQVEDQPALAKGVCSDQLLAGANQPLADSDQIALGKVADKIMALPGFDQDPNCLYVALQYELATGDAVKSRELFAKLEKTYNSAERYSKAFTVTMMSIDALRQNVEFLETSSKQSNEEATHRDETFSSGSEVADKYYKEHHQ